MKKTIIFSTTAFAVIGLITLTAISCNKNKPEIEKVTQTQYKSLAVSTASTYNCGSKPGNAISCTSFKNCAKKFMGSANSRNFTIKWTSCTAGCSILTTTGLACYTGSCNELNIQFNNLPICLQNCYPVPFCQKITQIVCQGSAYTIQYIADDGTQTISINGDPHISVECNPDPSSGLSICKMRG